MKSSLQFREIKLLSHKWLNEWVSERASSVDQANEWAVQANKRADEQMAQYSTRRFHNPPWSEPYWLSLDVLHGRLDGTMNYMRSDMGIHANGAGFTDWPISQTINFWTNLSFHWLTDRECRIECTWADKKSVNDKSAFSFENSLKLVMMIWSKCGHIIYFIRLSFVLGADTSDGAGAEAIEVNAVDWIYHENYDRYRGFL